MLPLLLTRSHHQGWHAGKAGGVSRCHHLDVARHSILADARLHPGLPQLQAHLCRAGGADQAEAGRGEAGRRAGGWWVRWSGTEQGAGPGLGHVRVLARAQPLTGVALRPLRARVSLRMHVPDSEVQVESVRGGLPH